MKQKTKRRRKPTRPARRRSKGERGLHYCRFVEMPVTVLTELRQVAEAADLPLRTALKHLLREGDLIALVREGLNRTDEFVGVATERLGVHLPAAEKQRVIEAAAHYGVQIGHVGRLVLIALAGRLAEAVRASQWAHLGAA